MVMLHLVMIGFFDVGRYLRLPDRCDIRQLEISDFWQRWCYEPDLNISKFSQKRNFKEPDCREDTGPTWCACQVRQDR
jgi:hypothetical protein